MATTYSTSGFTQEIDALEERILRGLQSDEGISADFLISAYDLARVFGDACAEARSDGIPWEPIACRWGELAWMILGNTQSCSVIMAVAEAFRSDPGPIWPDAEMTSEVVAMFAYSRAVSLASSVHELLALLREHFADPAFRSLPVGLYYDDAVRKGVALAESPADLAELEVAVAESGHQTSPLLVSMIADKKRSLRSDEFRCGSTGDYEVITRAAWDEFERCRALDAVLPESMPVLHFGDVRAYELSSPRVLTAGLNPSHNEFPVDDPWKRFQECGPDDVQAYRESLAGYFATDPDQRWFDESYEAILEGLGTSYYAKSSYQALHTNLCSPVATNPTWTDLPWSEQWWLAAGGVGLWHDFVSYARPDVILLSVAREHLSRIRFPMTQPQTLHVFRADSDRPYEILFTRAEVEPGHRSLIVYGRAGRRPFQLLNHQEKHELGAIVREALRS